MEWKLWKGSDAEWDAIVSKFPHTSFSQSSAWAELQRALGRDVIRVAASKANQPHVAVCQLALIKKTIGSFWLAQRGPIGGLFDESISKLLPGSAWFIRIEPDQKPPASFRRRASFDPSVSRLLDLSKTEEKLLADMHQKTRYNIRVAEKNGVTITESNNVDDFLLLQNDTASRDGFTAQSDDYVRKQYKILEKNLATILIADKDREPLAANFLIAYGDTVTYLYGASSSQNRSLMAPYLLHWESIKWAKQNGYRWYDFWGCNPESKDHPDYKESWEGISRFKAGWGGELIEYPGTYDVPLKKIFYYLMTAYRR